MVEPAVDEMDRAEQSDWRELLQPVMDRMIETGVDQVTITREGLEARVRFKPRPRK